MRDETLFHSLFPQSPELRIPNDLTSQLSPQFKPKVPFLSSDRILSIIQGFGNMEQDKNAVSSEVVRLDIPVITVNRGRVTGEGAETYYDATEAMADEEDDFDISSHSVQSEKGRRLPSTLSTTQGQASIKRVKKNVLLMLFMMLLCQLSNTLKVRKKNEDNRPSAKVIHEVVSSVGGLTRNEVFKATQRLMNGNIWRKQLNGTAPVTYIKALDIPPKTHKTISANTFNGFIHLFLGEHKLNDVALGPGLFGGYAKLIFEQDNHGFLVIKAVRLKWLDNIFLRSFDPVRIKEDSLRQEHIS
ncbi:hypothetical protein Leryth_002966 [Lithospermum erythrorhizon]|nr:hypothetical protein Leryth_002966 [Lithospermum erythrorhizon]